MSNAITDRIRNTVSNTMNGTIRDEGYKEGTMQLGKYEGLKLKRNRDINRDTMSSSSNNNNNNNNNNKNNNNNDNNNNNKNNKKNNSSSSSSSSNIIEIYCYIADCHSGNNSIGYYKIDKKKHP
ncbi:hypothetical protein PoB_005459200 [Plakobranchus ocellatus]|uniref:Uncharacterized protein n=1 Tax=Plakobranchus ocellatus TaxID=259542 RepID=A0AAV4C9Q2_9GAST|nr:hypothetical protein PoB_005459200 [Plakobranchus ocellatus]